MIAREEGRTESKREEKKEQLQALPGAHRRAEQPAGPRVSVPTVCSSVHCDGLEQTSAVGLSLCDSRSPSLQLWSGLP